MSSAGSSPGIFGADMADDYARQIEAQRRIDANRRAIERHGMAPAVTDPYFGLVPRNSPAGEVIGEGVDTAKDVGYFAREAVPNLATAGAVDWIKKGVDYAKWALKPRGAHQTAAFTDARFDPRKASEGPGSPVPPLKDAPGQAEDRLSKALGMDATGTVSSAKPPRGRAIDYDHNMAAGTIGFSFGGGPLKVYKPGESDITSGDYGVAPAGATSKGAASQTDVEKIPIGQRPATYMGDWEAQRAIEGAAPARGPLGRLGFSEDEARPYYGQAFVNEGLGRRGIDLEEARQRGPERTRQDYQAQLDDIEHRNQQAIALAKAIPDPVLRKDALRQVEARHAEHIQGLNTKFGLSERLNARSIYDAPLQ